MKVSVVIPMYNEEDNVLPLARELAAIAPAFEAFEVILVDDGSRDTTPDRIREAAAICPGLRGLRMTRNSGQSAAMLRGLAAARHDIVVTLDGDLQNDPADIPALASKVGEFDAVCGYRAKRRDTWSRRIGSRLANRIRNSVTHDGMRDTGCSLKAFRRECVADLPHLDGVHRFMPAYFRLHHRTICEVPVNHRARQHGVSKYTNLKRLPRTIRDLLGFAWIRSRHIGADRTAASEIGPGP